MNDRSIGYAILILLLVGCAALGIYLARMALFPAHLRVVAFSELGNIQIDEPVSIRGFPVGTIRKIQRRKGARNSFITLEFPQPVTIYGDYQVSNVEIGFMGDRMLMLDCGTPQYPVVSERDTLVGEFRPGISEAMNHVEILQDIIDSAMVVTTALLGDSEGKTSFLTAFRQLVSAIDSSTNIFVAATSQLDRRLSDVLDKVEAVSMKGKSLVDTTRTIVPGALSSVTSFMTRFETLADSLSAFLQTADTLLARANQQETHLRPQLQRLKGQLTEVKQAAEEIRSNGMTLNVRVVF